MIFCLLDINQICWIDQNRMLTTTQHSYEINTSERFLGQMNTRTNLILLYMHNALLYLHSTYNAHVNRFDIISNINLFLKIMTLVKQLDIWFYEIMLGFQP